MMIFVAIHFLFGRHHGHEGFEHDGRGGFDHGGRDQFRTTGFNGFTSTPTFWGGRNFSQG